jgi:hypothetical protein
MYAYSPREQELCDCTFGRLCAWHRERERQEQETQQSASVEELEDLIRRVRFSSVLSDKEKYAVMQILNQRAARQ